MSYIVTFCNKTIKETNGKIDQTDSILKTKLEKAEYKETQKTIASNVTATKKILFQSYPAGHVISLSNKSFTKDVCKLLNKNLNFVPTEKNFDKKTFDKEINSFYRRIKLKPHFKEAASNQYLTEDNIFKKRSSKLWVPTKNHHTIETFIKATKNNIDAEIKKLKRPKYLNLSKREQKALEELKVRDDIVITNADKVDAVVILDVKDYVKEC